VKNSIVLLIVVCISMPVLAQETTAPELPTTLGTVYYYPMVPPESKSILAPLAQELAEIKTSSKAFIGTKTYAELKGSKSAVQVPVGETKEFFVRGVDPTRFKLYRFAVKKNQRQVPIYDAGAFHGKIVTHESEVPIVVVELGNSSYKLVPVSPLAEGEYSFSPTDSNTAFTFGVMASEKELVEDLN